MWISPKKEEEEEQEEERGEASCFYPNSIEGNNL